MLRVGSRPQHEKLFAGEVITSGDGVAGLSRTLDELTTLSERLAAAIDELGGKVHCVVHYQYFTLTFCCFLDVDAIQACG